MSIYWFAQVHDPKHRAKPHQVRDSIAAIALRPALEQRYHSKFGIVIGGQRIAAMQQKLYTARDLIFVSTRLEISENVGRQRIIKWGNSDLDKLVSRVGKSFFKKCTRSEVLLHDEISLVSGDDSLRNVMYHPTKSGTSLDSEHCVGYLLKHPSQAGDPNVIMAFSMSGSESGRFCLGLSATPEILDMNARVPQLQVFRWNANIEESVQQDYFKSPPIPVLSATFE